MSSEAIEPAGTDTTAPVQYVDGHKESFWKKQIKVHAYIGEVLLLLGVLSVINLGVMPAQPGFFGISPNPIFAVILLMAARYGFRAGIFSAVLGAITYYLLLTSKINVISTRDLVSWQYAKPAVLFIVVGVIVGILVQRHRNRLVKYEEENDMLRRDNEQLRAGEEELRDVNVELANRVVGATDTLPMLYKYAKKLNTLDVDGIFTALTELVQEVLKAGRVSVYRLNKHLLELHSRDGRKASGPQLALEESLWDELITKRKVITLHDLLSRNIQRKDIFLAGPLTEGAGGDIQAVLVVEQLEFLRYNPATVRLFTVVTDWAANVLGTASEYKDNPAELQRQKNKREILRAQRATMTPGVVSAMTGQAAAGEVASGAKVDQAFIESPTVIYDRATPEATPMAGGGGGMGGLLGGASAGGAGALSKLLSGADDRLFGDVAQVGPVGVSSVVRELDDLAAPAQAPADRGMMQHLLTAELQMANEAGSPLAKLLAEIDGYVSGSNKAGSGGRGA